MNPMTKEDNEHIQRIVREYAFKWVLESFQDALVEQACNYRVGSPMSNKWMERANRLGDWIIEMHENNQAEVISASERARA